MQDISLSVRGRNVSRTSVLTTINIAEMKAADRMPLTFGRRLSILGRYVGAVLTAFLTPAAPILSIKTDVRASRNTDAVPRGTLELSLAGLTPRGFLSTPPTLARTGSPSEIPGGKRKRSCVQI